MVKIKSDGNSGRWDGYNGNLSDALLNHKHPVINIIIRNEVIETRPNPDL